MPQFEPVGHHANGAEYIDEVDPTSPVRHVNKRWVKITQAHHIISEVFDAAEDIEQGWFSDDATIDWESFWDRLEGTEIAEFDGRALDLGNDSESPALRKIKRHIRAWRSTY